MGKYPIGFNIERTEENTHFEKPIVKENITIPKKSVVDVFFPKRNMTLSYYNDEFDLHRGDLVYVDGKLEGLQGRVVDINYTFKIKLSEYKKVIAVIDTNIQGQFYITGSHIVTFDPLSLPYEKVIKWFISPNQSKEEFVYGEGKTSFPLDDLSKMDITQEIAERGNQYYLDNKVKYICLDGTKGKAILEGTESYEEEFDYYDGEVYNLVCSCFCSYPCKHEFAAMLQLRETLKYINDNYCDKYGTYFAAITKGLFIFYSLSEKETGEIRI